MNTELWLDHNISSSNKHRKNAKDNRITDLVKNWTWQKTASGSNVESTKSTFYRNLTQQNKAWHESTRCIEQKSLIDHKPKMTRRYDGKHVNIASFVIRFQTQQKKQSMAEILICRPLCELDALTTEQCMTNQAYLRQDGMFMKLSMARSKAQHVWINYNKLGKFE